MRDLRAVLLAVLAPVTVALLVLAPAPSSAFVRTTTCSSICHQVCPSDGVCADGGDGSTGADCALGQDCADCGIRPDPRPDVVTPCWDGDELTPPVPVAWLAETVEYVVDERGYSGIPDIDAILETTAASFESWNAAPGSNMRTVSGGLADVAVNNVDMVNLITFVEEGWRHAPAALAIASVTYSPCGEIVDVDIELNADAWSFRILGSGPVLATRHDLQNTLTHEIGHFLGLDHCHDDAVVGLNDCEEATMRVETEAGDTQMRDLSADDLAGIAYIYPTGGAPPETNSCPTTRTRKRGCAAAGQAPVSSAAWALGLAIIWYRRHQRHRR